MLPDVLSEKLCSLNPGVKRYAFSVFQEVTAEGVRAQKSEPRFTKTVIRSCAKLSYDVVEKVIQKEIQNE